MDDVLPIALTRNPFRPEKGKKPSAKKPAPARKAAPKKAAKARKAR